MNRKDFVHFLEEFRTELIQNHTQWENKTLADFLEAMIAYTKDVQSYYDNNKMKIDADTATWENFKTIMKGAKIYE